MHPKLEALEALRLPAEDYALFGSGPLLVRGWIDDVGDLDVIACGAAWERACAIGAVRRLERYGSSSLRSAKTSPSGRGGALVTSTSMS